jgi:hypothetical protein
MEMSPELMRWLVFAVASVLALLGLVFTVVPVRTRTQRRGLFQSKRSDQRENFERADITDGPARWFGAGFALAALAALVGGAMPGFVIGAIVYAVAQGMAYSRRP